MLLLKYGKFSKRCYCLLLTYSIYLLMSSRPRSFSFERGAAFLSQVEKNMSQDFFLSRKTTLDLEALNLMLLSYSELLLEVMIITWCCQHIQRSKISFSNTFFCFSVFFPASIEVKKEGANTSLLFLQYSSHCSHFAGRILTRRGRGKLLIGLPSSFLSLSNFTGSTLIAVA